MIVGQDILTRQLVTGGSAANLKNSTFDLTVGEIVPIGKAAVKARRRGRPSSTHFLEPREMVWVLSREEFNMPGDVTGFATLRTTLTKDGILALNVGIIDPFFKGPISTALINFSDKARRIDVGDKFFRVAFFEHVDVSAFHGSNENVQRAEYIKYLERASYADFSASFMNIPTFDDNFYLQKFWNIILAGLGKNLKVTIPLGLFLALILWFLVHLGLYEFVLEKLQWLRDLRGKIKF